MPKKKYSINWENDEAQSFEVNGVTYESLDDVPDWKDRDKLAAMLHASSEEDFEEVKFDEKEFEELRKAAEKMCIRDRSYRKERTLDVQHNLYNP